MMGCLARQSSLQEAINHASLHNRERLVGLILGIIAMIAQLVPEAQRETLRAVLTDTSCTEAAGSETLRRLETKLTQAVNDAKAVSTAQTTGFANVRQVRVKSMLDPAAYRRIKRNLFRSPLSVRERERPTGGLDYFMLLCGPLSAENQARSREMGIVEVAFPAAIGAGFRPRHDDVHVGANKLRHNSGSLLERPRRPPHIGGQVLTFDVAPFAQTRTERGQVCGGRRHRHGPAAAL